MGLFSKKDKEQVQEKKVPNPYLNGREEWLERYGNYIKQRDSWKFFSFIMLLIVLVSVSGNIYQGTQSKIVPYIVEVDKLGRAAAIERVDGSKRADTNKIILSVIAMVISDWRTVTADVELQKRMIKRLSYFTTGAAKGYMGEWYKLNNPYERGKEQLVTVELKSLPLVITQDSYKVEWTETMRNHQGNIQETVRYEATITIKIAPSMTEQMILYNPTGIFISHINATKLF